MGTPAAKRTAAEAAARVLAVPVPKRLQRAEALRAAMAPKAVMVGKVETEATL